MKLDAAKVAQILEESLLFYDFGETKKDIQIRRGQPGVLIAKMQIEDEPVKEFTIQVQETNWEGK